jgi:DNA-binding beta-propeller fold protein YncE
LSHALIGMTPAIGRPFGVAVSRDGRYSFVSGFRGYPNGSYVEVFSDHGDTAVRLRAIALGAPEAAGDTLTSDGLYLLVASGSGAAVLDVTRAEEGKAHALIGFLRSPESGTVPASAGQAPGSAILPGAVGSAIEVTTSPDSRYAFVSLEYSDEIAVFDLAEALATGLRSSGYVGSIPLGHAVVGMAISPNGHWLYATSEVAAGVKLGPLARDRTDGTLSVIDLGRATSKPSTSVVATVPAGCGTVRVAVSPDGRVVWVTARESDALLAFSASELLSDPKQALLARVRVGEAPVGLAVVEEGARIVVADSNRFKAPGERSGLTVVDASAALAGQPSLIGIARAGLFPRELALAPNGHTLLVTNFESGQLETIDLNHLG